MDQFFRVSFPTLILYVAVTVLESHICKNEGHCNNLISLLENMYIMFFIWADWELKSKKAEEKKLHKLNKVEQKKREDE